MTDLLVGAYGPDMHGTAAGIATAASAPGGLVLGEGPRCDSPAWLAVRGDRMVAAQEGSRSLAWFRRDGDHWHADGVTELGGEFPCHAAFLDDDTVAVACYGDGAVIREVFSLRGRILPGNSGGPILSSAGDVVGVVFAASVTDHDTGYALTAGQVAAAAAAGLTSSSQVSTGGCAG